MQPPKDKGEQELATREMENRLCAGVYYKCLGEKKDQAGYEPGKF